MSASVPFAAGQGGANGCSTTGNLGENVWAQYNGTTNGTNNNQMSATNLNTNQANDYDAAGNVLNDGVNAYLYDIEGRLCAVENLTVGTITQYVYDAEGTRVAKGKLSWTGSGNPTWNTACSATSGQGGWTFTLTTSWILGQGGEQVTELDAADVNLSNPSGWAHTNVFAGGALIATYDYAANNTLFALTDWLGTKRVEVGANPCATAYTSLPFGDSLTPASVSGFSACQDDATENHFTGKERDTESGNDYFGARYFASTMGRFLSPDWSAKAEPVPYAKLDDPQSLNLYAYVRNNPLSRTDPTGHYEFRNSGCGDNAKCQKAWDKRQDKFEKRREKDLNSKKADVRAAAAAYGARGEVNGVHVGFANSNGAWNAVTNPFNSTPGNIDIEVTIDNSRVGSDSQEHEGAHVEDSFKFLNSYDPAKGGYDQSLNPTHGQTEFNGLKVGAEIDHGHGLDPNKPQQIWDFIRNSPVYGPVTNQPMFPPALFPGPTGPED